MIPFNHDSNNVALNKKRRLFFSGCVSRSMTRLAILACEENRKLILHIKKTCYNKINQWWKRYKKIEEIKKIWQEKRRLLKNRFWQLLMK